MDNGLPTGEGKNYPSPLAKILNNSITVTRGAAVFPCLLRHQFNTTCEKLKVIGVSFFSYILIIMTLLHIDFGWKVYNVWKFVKNRVWGKLQNNLQRQDLQKQYLWFTKLCFYTYRTFFLKNCKIPKIWEISKNGIYAREQDMTICILTIWWNRIAKNGGRLKYNFWGEKLIIR